MRYFEMVGLPGAGKTTLIKSIDTDLGVVPIRRLITSRSRGSALRRYRQIWWRMPKRLQLHVLERLPPDAKDAASFIVRHPRLHQVVLTASESIPDPTDRELGVALLFETWSYYGYSERVCSTGEAVLFDEGIWQRLIFLLALVPDQPADEFLAMALETVPPLDGAILLDLPLKVAVERVTLRRDGFMQTGLMDRMASLLERTIDGLEAAGVPMIGLPAERPSRESLRDVRTFLGNQMKA
ncbi:MAG: hypothetical protein H0V93_03915 [Euzebyales bacterium]|nr:hypothetical protein [Euzebyales bacterium]